MSGLSGRFFLPGPVEVRADLLASMQRPMIGIHEPEMQELMGGLQGPLRRLFRTERPVLIGSCSSTGFMEAAVRGGVERRVLVVVGGYFGERFAGVAEACGREVVRAHVPPGATLEPAHLERFLEGPDVDAVALVHSETSTGALAPLEALARVVRTRPNVLLLVDAVTSVGGSPVETDAWDLDFVFTGTQKALALPPGLALGAASERFFERARGAPDRGWYLDPVKHLEAAERRLPTQSPALPLLYALEAQLRRIDEERLEHRWARHTAMRELVERWVEARPALALLAPAGRRASTVSAIAVPPHCSARAIATELRRRGFVVGVGLPPLTERILRIGHMGDLEPADVSGLLEALEPLVM